MAVDYISSLKRGEDLCNEFEQDTILTVSAIHATGKGTVRNLVWTEPYREGLKLIEACVQFCRVVKLQPFGEHESVLYKIISSDLGNPNILENIDIFRGAMEYVRNCFHFAQPELLSFCSAFDEEEEERINEAVHAYLEDCNYSCVVMSVSAAESRLLKLMCLACPTSERELEKKTLGQLISEYVNNEDKYKNTVPKKHHTLLQFCNTYRTLSVHPKKEKITGRLADSILNLTVEFLTDPYTKPEVVKTQLKKYPK